ncbi:MAG: type II toxin-antitoxin system prevent-host-death family antitoxin [Prevotella sp.]|jgi:antitoxin YefM|nr:type II toxin-antitoxin system prevent-host-death family antitoxin [Prevotella sp.]
MNTASYTELRNNLKSYLDKVINDSEPLIVHRSGNESVVVISLDEYNSIKETEYIKSSPAMTERIKMAEDDLQAGKGKTIKIADLWK